MELHPMKMLLYNKENNQKHEKATYRGKKAFASHIFDMGLIYKMCKEIL